MLVVKNLESYKALPLVQAIDLAQAGKLGVGIEYHAVDSCENAIVVHPVNEASFVFVAPFTSYVFQHEEGNGTDHARQRMLAQAFFETIKEYPPSVQACTAVFEAIQFGALADMRKYGAEGAGTQVPRASAESMYAAG